MKKMYFMKNKKRVNETKTRTLNESTIRKIVAETLRRLIKEYEDDDLGDDYVDPDDWRSEEPSHGYVQSTLENIEQQCNACGAVFKNLGDNEFGVIIKDANNSSELITTLKDMKERREPGGRRHGQRARRDLLDRSGHAQEQRQPAPLRRRRAEIHHGRETVFPGRAVPLGGHRLQQYASADLRLRRDQHRPHGRWHD